MSVELVAKVDGNAAAHAFDLISWRLDDKDCALIGGLGETGVDFV